MAKKPRSLKGTVPIHANLLSTELKHHFSSGIPREHSTSTLKMGNSQKFWAPKISTLCSSNSKSINTDSHPIILYHVSGSICNYRQITYVNHGGYRSWHKLIWSRCPCPWLQYLEFWDQDFDYDLGQNWAIESGQLRDHRSDPENKKNQLSFMVTVRSPLITAITIQRYRTRDNNGHSQLVAAP